MKVEMYNRKICYPIAEFNNVSSIQFLEGNEWIKIKCGAEGFFYSLKGIVYIHYDNTECETEEDIAPKTDTIVKD